MDLVVRCGRPHKLASVYLISMFCSCLPFFGKYLSKKKKNQNNYWKNRSYSSFINSWCALLQTQHYANNFSYEPINFL